MSSATPVKLASKVEYMTVTRPSVGCVITLLALMISTETMTEMTM
jgi:pyrimidine deaminase RibD-like protein